MAEKIHHEITQEFQEKNHDENTSKCKQTGKREKNVEKVNYRKPVYTL